MLKNPSIGFFILRYKQKTSKTKKNFKQNNIVRRKKIYKNTIKFIMCWESLAGHGPALRCYMQAQGYSIWENKFLFTCNYQLESFLFRDGKLCPLPFRSRHIWLESMQTPCKLPQSLSIHKTLNLFYKMNLMCPFNRSLICFLLSLSLLWLNF